MERSKGELDGGFSNRGPLFGLFYRDWSAFFVNPQNKTHPPKTELFPKAHNGLPRLGTFEMATKSQTKSPGIPQASWDVCEL